MADGHLMATRGDEEDAEPYRMWVLWCDQGVTKKVQFDPNPETHAKAIKAYRRKAHVRVSGRLERLGRKWSLFGPKNFSVG